MKLLADENIEGEIVAALRAAGFEVADVKKISPGIEDDAGLTMANDSDSVLLTNDKDFGELVYRDRLTSSGIILLRFEDLSMEDRIERLTEVLNEHADDLSGSFTVVSNRGVRIRTRYLS